MSKKVKVEADAKQIVLNRLIEKGWVWNAHDVKSASGKKIKQNIFFERPPIPIKELGRKRPDILLYDNKNNKPIGIIEVKKAGARLDSALTAGIEKAESIGVKVVFASNGGRVEARFVPNKKTVGLRWFSCYRFFARK
jgi:type I site-specific restriction endonuclease